MDALLRDLRYSCRRLLRRPGFTAVALLPLGQALISPNSRQAYVRAGGLIALAVSPLVVIRQE